jgi:hypothetical protein
MNTNEDIVSASLSVCFILETTWLPVIKSDF